MNTIAAALIEFDQERGYIDPSQHRGSRKFGRDSHRFLGESSFAFMLRHGENAIRGPNEFGNPKLQPPPKQCFIEGIERDAQKRRKPIANHLVEFSPPYDWLGRPEWLLGVPVKSSGRIERAKRAVEPRKALDTPQLSLRVVV